MFSSTSSTRCRASRPPAPTPSSGRPRASPPPSSSPGSLISPANDAEPGMARAGFGLLSVLLSLLFIGLLSAVALTHYFSATHDPRGGGFPTEGPRPDQSARLAEAQALLGRAMTALTLCAQTTEMAGGMAGGRPRRAGGGAPGGEGPPGAGGAPRGARRGR